VVKRVITTTVLSVALAATILFGYGEIALAEVVYRAVAPRHG
jgi:hypothetical protein